MKNLVARIIFMAVAGLFLIPLTSNQVSAQWIPPTCSGQNFTGCHQINQARCTDFGGPVFGNWTPALWQQCSNICSLPDPNNFCSPWAPPTCTGNTFSGCHIQGQPGCTDYGWPAYTGWTPALGNNCNIACSQPNPNNFCIAPPPTPTPAPTPPPTPNCNITPSCIGICNATANTCSANNGTRSGCTYTAFSGGGSCTVTAAPNQPCTLSNCNAGFTCTAGVCTPPAIPLTACQSVNSRLQGLLSTPNLLSPTKFGSVNGQCVVDPVQAGIVSFKIPTYDQLRNTYFERKNSINTGPNQVQKITLPGPWNGLDFQTGGCGGNCSRLWKINGDLIIPNQASIQTSTPQNAIIFVEGNLNLGDLNAGSNPTCNSSACSDIRYGDNNHGIVYLVKGNVNIGRNINIFDGIIISQGIICTSYDNSCVPDSHSNAESGGETKQLIVNGNLVSLDPTKPIEFRRNLIFSTCGGACPTGNDTTPAEIVNVQPKYLVVMKDLLSETFTIQTEDTHFAINQ